MLDDDDLVSSAGETLPPRAASIRQARRRVDEVLRTWPDPQREVAELLTTELVTNAVVHARTPFTLQVIEAGLVARVDVTDHGGGHPHVLDPDHARLGGRGLWIVNELASRWGVRNEGDATTVWFELDLHEGSSPPADR